MAGEAGSAAGSTGSTSAARRRKWALLNILLTPSPCRANSSKQHARRHTPQTHHPSLDWARGQRGVAKGMRDRCCDEESDWEGAVAAACDGRYDGVSVSFECDSGSSSYACACVCICSECCTATISATSPELAAGNGRRCPIDVHELVLCWILHGVVDWAEPGVRGRAASGRSVRERAGEQTRSYAAPRNATR